MGNITLSLIYTLHRYTRSRILGLHWPYLGNGFITVSLALQITLEVFFAPSDSFLAFILRLPVPKTGLNSIPLLPSSYPGSSKLDPSLPTATATLLDSVASSDCLFISPRHGPRRKRSLCCQGGVFTGPLPSNGHAIVHVPFAGMFLPSRCLAVGIHVTVYMSTVSIFKIECGNFLMMA
jgi:hypothetical protein